MRNEQGIGGKIDVEKSSANLLESLTPRQCDVLALLCEGWPNKLIARRLNISSGTVKVHVVHILRALKVTSRLQATIVARSLGFENMPDRPVQVRQVLQAQSPARAAPSRILPVPTQVKAAEAEASCLLAAFAIKRLDAVVS